MRLNKRLLFLQESETLRLNVEAKRLNAQGRKIINLTAGELDFETPLYLQRAVKRKLHLNKYTPTLGLPQLRTLLAKKVGRECKRTVFSDQIAVTAGAKQALFELFQVLLNPGDEVIIPTPYWVSYAAQIKLARGIPVFVPLGTHFDLDVSAIKSKITRRTKAIVINSPHNPTGKVFSKVALTELASLLKGKEIVVVYDEVYRDLQYTKTHRNSSAAIFIQSKLALIGSFSKSQALTGWRIGYLVANREIIDRVGCLQSHLSSNAAILSQYAAIAALQNRATSAGFVSQLKRRRALVGRMLRAIPRIRFQDPDGAFYVFIDIRTIDRDDERFCKRLLNIARVMLVPGKAFGAPGFVRLSFAAPERELIKGIHALKEFVVHYHV